MAEQNTNTWDGPGNGNTGDAMGGGSVGGTKSGLGEQIKSAAASAADSTKERAVAGLGAVADVAANAGEELRGQSDLLASWVNMASDQLRGMADRLRERQPGELADDLARFARERPALFVGGAFLIGLGLARVLKSAPAGSARQSAMGMSSGGSTIGNDDLAWDRPSQVS
jgi:hypothetical protein